MTKQGTAPATKDVVKFTAKSGGVLIVRKPDPGDLIQTIASNVVVMMLDEEEIEQFKPDAAVLIANKRFSELDERMLLFHTHSLMYMLLNHYMTAGNIKPTRQTVRTFMKKFNDMGGQTILNNQAIDAESKVDLYLRSLVVNAVLCREDLLMLYNVLTGDIAAEGFWKTPA